MHDGDDVYVEGEDEEDIPEEALEFLDAACASPNKSTSYVPSGATPSMNGQLTAAAAEFWFPSSRECKCCNGYRHACECVTKNGFAACQTDPGCCPPEFLNVKKAVQAAAPASSGAPSLPRPSQQASAYGMAVESPSPGSGGYSGGRSGGRTGGSPRVQYCRNEGQPGGCRFGSSCRFAHVGGNNSPNTQQQQQNYYSHSPRTNNSQQYGAGASANSPYYNQQYQQQYQQYQQYQQPHHQQQYQSYGQGYQQANPQQGNYQANYHNNNNNYHNGGYGGHY